MVVAKTVVEAQDMLWTKPGKAAEDWKEASCFSLR